MIVNSATVEWDSGGQQANWDVVENWDTDALPTSSDTVALRNGDRVQYTATAGTTLISRLLLGDSATDNKGELKVSGGTLKTITSGNAVVSEIGRGQMGRLSLIGGSTTVNFGHRIRIGSGIDGFGWLAVSDDASLVVGRAGTSSIDTSKGPVSIDLGADDEGALGTIRMDSGGSLTTRTGIVIGGNGIFRIRGSDTNEIGIGSHGTLDGFWLQKEGGILCVNIDDDDTGVTPIFIDEVDTSNGSAGNVVFENGALLYVDFSDASRTGTFTVMEWEGSVTNHGLAFHPDVNTDVWSFEIDTTDKELRVTAATPTSLSSIIWRNTANGGYLTATTGVKDNNFANKVNWGWDGNLGGAKAKIDFHGVNRAVLNSGTIENLAALEIGCNGGNGEFEQSGSELYATANSAAVSSIGRNQTGTWIMSGGTAEINAIRIGLGDGAGNMIIEDGDLTVKRAYGTNPNGYSLFVGSGGTANFEISGGSLTTRSGVKLSDKGTFSVRGSGATIGIGSYGTVDGRWVQESGGLLEIMIDDTNTGVAKIVVDETDGSSSFNGDVTFENGALLAPSFWGKGTPGTYTIMEWDGTLTDNGLAFHQDVDTDVWSFNVDEANKRLTVTAQGTDLERTAVTVDSIEELRQYLDREYHDITMAPGTYWMTGPTTRPAGSKEGGRFLDFRGEHSKYVFTDVHLKVDTQELYGYGSTYSVHMLHVTGDNITVDGLTLSMEKLTLQGKDKYGYDMEWFNKAECSLVRVIGSNTTIKNCEFTTGGSYPYGYGDAFGKGLRPVDENGVTHAAWSAPKKMSGFLITEGASDVKVENVTLNMKSFGHGFYIQLGAKDIEYINCTVNGDDMADSDDIIAHPEYQKWGFASYSEPIPSDIRISKHEGGIRAYYNDDYQTNGYPERVKNVTIDNCRIERMRDATAFGDAAGYLRVSNTEVYECEMGFGTNGFGTENTFTNCKGDALNGPLIYFQRSVADNSTSMEIELTGDCPGKGIWPIALISGNDNEITLTSSAKPGVYSKGAYVNLSQKWREWRHRPDFDIDAEQSNHYAESSTGNTILNYTDQILVFGENATNNTGCESSGPVIDKGSGNSYLGSDLVSGLIEVQDTWSSPPNPMNVPWAQWDSGGTQILPTLPYTVYEGLEVYYSDNYPVYAWGVPITPNSPAWTTPGTPISYIISPNLPDSLHFDATTGVISGTPTELKEETTYLVKAYYSANIYATVDLRITVNDVVAILLEGTIGSPDMRVTFNGSGSWVTAGSTVATFGIGHDEVANSSHQSLGNTRKEGIRDVLITGGTGDNPMKPALGGNYSRGQYVALDTPIEMTADVCKSPFNVIGLLFDDDDDEGAGKDDIVLVTDQPENTTTWPAGTEITYTAGATATFSLYYDPVTDIGANFDDAFNTGVYTLNDGLVGSLEIDETVAPSNLNYDTNTVTYTLGEEITANEPSSNGSAVDSYEISLALPAGLNFDTATGVISGTPSAPSGETTYTVTATNTAGWVTKTLTITVNDVVAILLEGIDYSRKMRVTFNGITGSWVTAAATASAFAYDDQDVANSDDESLKNDQEIGETKEGIRDVQITGGDPMNAALNGSNDAYPKGQYVALDTPITMEADQDPSEFNVIGLLFDDDSTDPTTNGDDIVLVTDQPDTTTWPAGTKITYTAGATATFSRDSSIGADFDDAFNIGVYTLNEGLVGSLQIDETVAPSELEYPTDDNDTLIFSLGVPVEYVPTSEGSAVDDYEISPVQLPAGLNFNTTTGVISGTPTELSAATDYTVTATNTAGSSTPVTLKIIVNDVVAILLEGTKDVYKMRVTFNGETGSWVTAADTEKAFTYDDDDVANSNDDSLGNLSREGFKVDRITGGNAMNAALNDTDSNGLPAYPEGQYVALDTPIAMEAETDPDPTEFYVIGLLFNDDSTDPTPNGDDVILVTDQPEDTTTWPAGTKITYTLGASTTFSLNSNVGADFDDAFNIGVYTLNEGVVGNLKIAATVAPTNLKYTQDNTLTFTLGVNTEYVPTSDGSAVDTYTITPALPAGLSLNTATGVISGAPTGLNAATSYTVTATNTEHWTTATLTITVNDVVAILLEGTTGVSQMRVTFKGETGSWVTAESTVAAFEYNNSNVLNSDDESLNNDQGTGETKEGIRDLKITGGNAINAELGGIYVMGQYVALDPSIEMTAMIPDEDPSSFKVIGLLFDDDGESMVNEDDITLVTDQPENTTTWPADTEITYTVGDTATFSLKIDPVTGNGATFGQAFNIGAYTLDEGLVGSLQIAATVAPSNLSYTTNPVAYTKGVKITENEPTSDDSAVDSYSISPALPAGLSLDTATGVISGTPTVLSAEASYTVTATNTAGSTTLTLTITVNDVAPSNLSYTTLSAIYTKGVTITDNSPSSAGGAVVSYSITPNLPSGLDFNQDTGVISGTPSAVSASVYYAVTATNTGGSATVTLTITVNDVAPSNLSYTANTAIYSVGVIITPNVPTSTGGAVVSYQISPSLPDGLIFNDITGEISGTPTALSAETTYTVTAYNSDGSTSVSLTITVNDVAPSGLSYATNPAIYTKDVEITTNVPTPTGGAVVSYEITPDLPAGLSWDPANGYISGKPTAVSPATTYTVTARNSGGSVTATLRIAVNDQKHLVLLLKGTANSGDMTVTFNGTGSWVTAADTASAFTYADSNVANSSDASLGGSGKEGFHDYLITGGNAMNAALSGSFADGQYVALATSIAMTADGGPSSFNVIGLLFNDDSDPTAGQDDVILVTDQADTSSWPSATEISYTVGASVTFSLDSGIGATFDEAFNKDIYTLNDGLVGSLKLGEIMPDEAPSGLTYGDDNNNALTFTRDEGITSIEPTTSGGSEVGSYSISPTLPAGLDFNKTTGEISGTPTALSAETTYTVTAYNSDGSTSVSLTITVNDVAPSGLSYATNPAIYTKDVEITPNVPTSTGGAVVSYSINPPAAQLPAGLSWDPANGYISGKPTAVSPATTYTVTARNSGGSVTATLRIAVNDQKHLVLLLKGTADSGDMTVTFNGTGSWVTAADTASAFTYADSNVANSSDASLGGSGKEGFHDYLITGGNAMNAALSGSFADGQYVALATSIAMTADGGPSSFNVIGLLFNDDSDPTAGQDDVILVTDQADTSSWPSATEISYTVGASVTFSLDSGIGATFDEAFNKDIYTLNDGLVGSLKLGEIMPDEAPSGLTYGDDNNNALTFTRDEGITSIEPTTSGGSEVGSYSISPTLPAGLDFNKTTGEISGTPTALSAETTYTVTAYNSDGSTSVSLTITVNDVAPSGLSYATNPAIYTKDVEITPNVPTSTGGAVVSYLITPGLPAGLSLSASGVISGTPTAVSPATTYTVTATNTAAGSATVTLRITVNDQKHLVLLLKGTDDSGDMTVTFNGTGSWTTSGSTASAFTYADSNVANSSDASLGGSGKEGFHDYLITGGNAMNAALSGSFADGQYVALATSIAMTADGGPSSFNVIGLLFNDDSDPTAGQDDVILVTDQADTSSWPSATEISYTVGASVTFSLDSGIGATFDEAFNKDIYTLNDGLVGSLKLGEIMPDEAPSGLTYGDDNNNALTFTRDEGITSIEPTTSGGSEVGSYSISPTLPAGLDFNKTTGEISGTPTALSPATTYTVTAYNSDGSTSVSLTITVNDVAPSGLSYATNPAIYIKDVTIPTNVPTPTGGAVVSYSINPPAAQLPAGLSWDPANGYISGKPTAVSPATTYTVTARNSGGSVTATLRIAVNDQKHLVLLLKGTADSGDMTVTFNGTGSWVTAADTASAFTYADSNVANSSDASLGGSGKEGFHDYLITGGNAMNAALSGSFADGQYVALATSIAMTADGGPSSFNVIGLLFNDDSDPTAGQDDVILVTDQADTSSWPSATEISYTVGASVTFSLDSGIGATFDEAFNKDIYTLNDGLVGSLKLGEIMPDEAPSGLTYGDDNNNALTFTRDEGITSIEPTTSGGSEVGSYSISPTLPAGLDFNKTTGEISGTPSALSAETDYRVTAYNSDGSTSVSLTITVNDVAPSGLSYATNPAIYTKGLAITPNVPTSTGGAVVSYLITPGLPAGLSLSASGVISGTPNAVSPATTYTVTATNSGDSTTATLRIAVNDQKHLVLLLKGTDESGDMTVTFNGTGSWVTAADTASAFTYADSNVANSSDASLGGSGKEGFHDYLITGGNAMNAALSGSFADGQYVALATSIAMTADGGPSSFNVIGLLFNDDSDPTAGQDDVILVTDQADTSSWPSATEISYTVGASVTFSLDSGIGATFDEAFNKDIYTLNDGLVGSLKLGEIMPDEAPSGLTYGDDNNNALTFTRDEGITSIEPTTSGGSEVGSYSISPTLPAGLDFNKTTGEISGTPTALSPATTYTVTAYNSDGSTSVSLTITVNDVAPSGLSYATNPAIYIKDVTIPPNVPTPTGGAVVSYLITPGLPAGLSLSASSGVISGTPTALSAETDYTVTATNTAGSATVTLRITVNDQKHLVLLLEGTSGSRDMRVTFNGTGSWVMKSDSDTSFSFGSSQVANSSDASLGGSSKEALQNVQISGGNPMNAALSGSFENGQYVALATPIAMTSDDGAGLFSFNVIGLLFDDDSTDSTPNGDDIVLVTDQPDTSSWTSYFTEIFYTVGTSTTFSLDSGIGATFDDAFNQDIYDLDEGLVGSLKIKETVAPDNLKYTQDNILTFTLGVNAEYEPTSTGGAVVSYLITPGLPAGLSLDTATGVISGTPSELSAATEYTVTAYNSDGSTSVSLTITVKLPLITVNDGAPSALSYTTNPAIYTKGLAITNNSPSSSGGNVAYYWITPALPSGLSFDRYTGVISGTPTELSPATDYTVRATNTAGWDEVTLEITVFGKDLQEWRKAHFANMEDPVMEDTEWGNMADPDGDGWINAFEFFFGTDPQSLDMNSPMRYEFVEEEVDCIAVLEFERSKAAPAGAGVVQYASDLSQWQTVSAPAEVVEDLGDRELVRVSMRLEQQATRHFMRLALDLEMF